MHATDYLNQAIGFYSDDAGRDKALKGLVDIAVDHIGWLPFLQRPYLRPISTHVGRPPPDRGGRYVCGQATQVWAIVFL